MAQLNLVVMYFFAYSPIALIFAPILQYFSQQLGLAAPKSEPDGIFILTSLILLAAWLAYQVRNETLGPIWTTQDASRFRTGHTFIAIGNLLVIATFGVPMLLGVLVRSELSLYAYFSMAGVPLAILFWIRGYRKISEQA